MRNLAVAAAMLACAVPAQAATYTYGGSIFVEIDETFTSIWLGDSESVNSFYWSPQPNRAYDFTLTLSRPAALAVVAKFSFGSVLYQQWDSDGVLRDDTGYIWDWEEELATANNATVLRGRYTPFTYTDERASSANGRWRQREWTWTHPSYADLVFATEGMLDYTVTLSGPVPEPAAWAMMVAGFGLVGAALRRRNAGTVKFAAA